MKTARLFGGLVTPFLFSLALTACGGSPTDPSAPAGDEGPVVEQPAPGMPTASPTATATAPTTKPPVAPACSPLVPRTVPLEVSALPEAGATPFVSVLSRATRTIRVMVYEMGTGPIIDALEAKARAGV